MTHTLHISLMIMGIGILSATFLPSCDNDQHDPDIELSGDISKLVPSYSVDLSCSYNYNTSRKYIHLEAEPNIFLNLDKWGLSIDKVDYYVDDVFYETKTSSPYRFTYESNDWYTGAHTVRADLTISGKNIETMILPCTKVIDNSSTGTKAADIYFDYNYVTTGEELCLTVCFNPEKSAPGTRIISAEASWDGISIGKKTSAPFKFTKEINDAPGTKHDLRASVTYEQGKVKTTEQYIYSSYEICGPTSIRYSYDICSKYRDFENGDQLKGRAKLFKGKEVTSNRGLEIYLDNVLIAETKEFPFEHEYTLSNLSIGEHTVTEKWITYDVDWVKQGSVSSDEIITITK